MSQTISSRKAPSKMSLLFLFIAFLSYSSTVVAFPAAFPLHHKPERELKSVDPQEKIHELKGPQAGEDLDSNFDPRPITNLTTGRYLGYANSSLDWFLGIPYAEPPVGELRFKAAVPLNRTSSRVWDATHWGDQCAQQSQNNSYGTNAFPPISENCLTVNVMRPQGTTKDSKIPVLIWIFGGGFYNGAASQYNPTAIISRSVNKSQPIIFGSLNYRLNADGFLYHPDVVSPIDSNRGFTDLQLALRFLKDNIEAFGGDPERITIWGQSAGGSSVEAQLIYAKDGLFRSVIVDSPWYLTGQEAHPDPSNGDFWTLSQATGCGTNDTASSQNAYRCLVGLPFDTFLNATTSIIESGSTHFGPLIIDGDDSFIPTPSKERIETGNYNKVPSIIGTCRDDGSYFTSKNYTSQDQILKTTKKLVAAAPGLPSSDEVDSISQSLLQMYLDDPTLQGMSLTEIGWALGGDWIFLTDRRFMSDHIGKENNLWTYLYSQPLPGKEAQTFGAHHSSEMDFFFDNWRNDGTPSNPQDFETLQNQLIDYWINFVNFGDPNGENLPNWPQNKENVTINFVAGNTTAIADNFRRTQTNRMVEIEAPK